MPEILRKTAAGLASPRLHRVILGTIAITDRSLVERLAREHPGPCCGLDARNGRLADAAWLDQTEVEAETLASKLLESGVETLIYTDIPRDGTLSGPNLEAIKRMVVIAGDPMRWRWQSRPYRRSIEDRRRWRDRWACPL